MGEVVISQPLLCCDDFLFGWDGPRMYGNSKQSEPPIDECESASPFHDGRNSRSRGEVNVRYLCHPPAARSASRPEAGVVLHTIR